eukprot:COSAG01_NODE_1999_length_8688_cov_6.237280_5_plen_85_part_00
MLIGNRDRQVLKAPHSVGEGVLRATLDGGLLCMPRPGLAAVWPGIGPCPRAPVLVRGNGATDQRRRGAGAVRDMRRRLSNTATY